MSVWVPATSSTGHGADVDSGTSVSGEGVAGVVSPCRASSGGGDAGLCSLLRFSSGVSITKTFTTDALRFRANAVEVCVEGRMFWLASSISVWAWVPAGKWVDSATVFAACTSAPQLSGEIIWLPSVSRSSHIADIVEWAMKMGLQLTESD